MSMDKKILIIVLLFLTTIAILGCAKKSIVTKEDRFYYFEAEDYADLLNWYIDNNIIGHTGLGYLIGITEQKSELPINIRVSPGEYSLWTRIYPYENKDYTFKINNEINKLVNFKLNKWQWKKICTCNFITNNSFSIINPGGDSSSKIIIDSILLTTDDSFDPEKELVETGLSIESLQANHKPLMEFDPKNFKTWKKQLRIKLTEILGDPHKKKSELNPITFQKIDEGSFTRQRVVFHSSNNTIVDGYLLIPKFIDKKIPAIIALPGTYANKEIISGREILDIPSTKKNYDIFYKQAYALNLVNSGYIVLAIDLPYYGERYQSDKAHQYALYSQWSGGTTVMSQAVTDIIRAIDYLETRKEVDKNKIGIVGLSLGGSIALFASAIDERLKATILSNALTTYETKIIEKQLDEATIPIKQYADFPDIALLIAPRAFFIENADNKNNLVPFNNTIAAINKIKQGYDLIGKSENFDYEIAENMISNIFIGKKSLKWLNDIMDYAGIFNKDKEKIKKIAIYRKNTYMSLSDTSQIISDSDSIDGHSIKIGEWLAAYDMYPPGNFLISFRIKADEIDSINDEHIVAKLVIKQSGYPINQAMVIRHIKASELKDESYHSFILNLRVNELISLEFDVLKTNNAKIIVDKIFVMPR